MSESKAKDNILYAFSIEPRHDQATLERYLLKYPELIEDLIDLSQELRTIILSVPDGAPQPDRKAEEAWKAFVECAPASRSVTGQSSLFAGLKGAALVELATKLDIPRALLTGLRDRLGDPSTIPMRFLSRLATASNSPIKAIQEYLALPPVTSLGLQFKSDNRPANQGQVPFRKLVDDTAMTDKQRETLLRDWVENGQE